MGIKFLYSDVNKIINVFQFDPSREIVCNSFKDLVCKIFELEESLFLKIK